MNMERSKSIILIILVITSGYLTWNIWTYEPKYEKMDQGNYINIATDERTASDVIKPTDVLIHRYYRHYLTYKPRDLEKAEQQMSGWELSHLREKSTSLTKKEFNFFTHENGTTEIRFSDSIPLTLYKTALHIRDKEVPAFSFDKILYKQRDIQSGEGVIYFASSENQSLLEAKVQTRDIEKFNQTFYQSAQTYPEYVAYSVNSEHQVFVPKNRIALKRYKYVIDYLDTSNLKDALFSDPLNVRHEFVSSGEEYTDSTSLLSVDTKDYMISYINPSQKRKMLSSSSDLLEKSIQFINNHAGWREGNFRFATINVPNQSVTFRLYKDGYPVFNQIGLSEIREIWGDEEIFSFKRPDFTLDSAFPPEDHEVILPSGPEVMEKLKKIPDFDYSHVEDLMIGYKLSISSIGTDLISLEPTWYYRIGDSWIVVPLNESGGKINGLE